MGIAKYRFPEGDKYVEAVCVTFPWVMSTEQLKLQDLTMGGFIVHGRSYFKKCVYIVII